MNVPSSKKDLAFAVLVCLLLSFVTFQIYIPVFNHDFINYDDNLYVVENHQVKQGLTLDNVKWAFLTLKAYNWHPVTWLSHMLDVSLFGLAAGKHHMTSVIIHSLNAVLLFFVFLRTTNQLWPSSFIAAFFAVHPMHVESVAWIAERKDVLSLFFMLITILFYINYVKLSKKTAYWASVFFFAIGLMSKPMLVTLPCILLLFDYWPLQRFYFPENGYVIQLNNEEQSSFFNIRLAVSLIIEKIPFFIMSLMSCIITVIAQKKGGAVVAIEALPLTDRLSNAVISYLEYIKKLFYPVELILPYPYPENISWSDLVIPVLLLSSVTFMALYYLQKKPYLIVGWMWFLGTLVPVIGIVQVGAQSMADRYVYIPYIGLYIILIFSLYAIFNDLFNGRFFVHSALFCLLIFFVYLGSCQVGLWKDSVTLFSHAIKVNNRNSFAHSNLGDALRRQNRIQEAEKHFSEAIAINPQNSNAHNGIGICYVSLNRYDEAIKSLLTAIKLAPDFAIAYFNIGYIYLLHQNYSEAADYFMKSIELSPYFSEPYLGMGIIYYMKHDGNNAIIYLQKARLLGSLGAKEYLDKLNQK